MEFIRCFSRLVWTVGRGQNFSLRVYIHPAMGVYGIIQTMMNLFAPIVRKRRMKNVQVYCERQIFLIVNLVIIQTISNIY